MEPTILVLSTSISSEAARFTGGKQKDRCKKFFMDFCVFVAYGYWDISRACIYNLRFHYLNYLSLIK